MKETVEFYWEKEADLVKSRIKIKWVFGQVGQSWSIEFLIAKNFINSNETRIGVYSMDRMCTKSQSGHEKEGKETMCIFFCAEFAS